MAYPENESTTMLTTLLVNAEAIVSTYFDMFFNPNPIDVTLNQYDSDGVIKTYTVPNMAKYKLIFTRGYVNPEGNVESKAGGIYLDIITMTPYVKTSEDSSTSGGALGWTQLLTPRELLAHDTDPEAHLEWLARIHGSVNEYFNVAPAFADTHAVQRVYIGLLESLKTSNKSDIVSAINNLQDQVDTIVQSSDVFDIVGTYTDLENYDTDVVPPNDIIKVLRDATHGDAITYYRCIKVPDPEVSDPHNPEDYIFVRWDYVGEEGPYYTKTESDNRFIHLCKETPIEYPTETIRGVKIFNNDNSQNISGCTTFYRDQDNQASYIKFTNKNKPTLGYLGVDINDHPTYLQSGGSNWNRIVRMPQNQNTAVGDSYLPVYIDADGIARAVTVLNNTSIGDLGYTDNTLGRRLVTQNSITFWNGQYSVGNSNLRYCTGATNNEIVGTLNNQTISGVKTFTGANNTFKHADYGAGLTIKRDGIGYSSIKFSNNNSTLGYLGVSATGKPVFTTTDLVSTNLIRNQLDNTAVGSTYLPVYTDTDGVVQTVTVLNNTSFGALGWTDNITGQKLITQNSIAYWDGRYTSGTTGANSNLKYCNGAVNNEIVGTLNNQTISGVKTFSSTPIITSGHLNLNNSGDVSIQKQGTNFLRKSLADDVVLSSTGSNGIYFRPNGDNNVTGQALLSTDGNLTAVKFTGPLIGNASTATTLQTARNINGTSFNGSADITTTNWGTARNIGIVNSDGTGTAVTVSVNGSGNVNLKLPSAIKASLTGDVTGNASTATTLKTPRSINGTNFDGSANITTANWGTQRAIGIVNSDGTGTAVTVNVNGSGNVNLKLPASIKASLTGNVTGDVTGNASSASLAQRVLKEDIGANEWDAVYLKGVNDYFRIRYGETTSNAGWVELATADDGNEPIYVRQYTGVFSNIARTLTLLDGSGNTSIPGTLSAPKATLLSSDFGNLEVKRNSTSSDSAIKFSNNTETTGYIGMSSGKFPRQWLGSDTSKFYNLVKMPQNQTTAVGGAGTPVYINEYGIAQACTSINVPVTGTVDSATKDGSGNVITDTYQPKSTAVTHSANTVVGSSTQPVYIAQNGTATACGFTVQTNVPANAVFTDTKVTQTLVSDNNAYRLLATPVNQNATTTTTSTFSKGININPSLGKLMIQPQGGQQGSLYEGGEIQLQANTGDNTKGGIILDNYQSNLRIFGIASADGTSKTGSGTSLVIDPWAKTITGGYTFTGNVTGNCSGSSGSCTGNAATATTATKLGSSTVGGTTQPIYLNAGTATACNTMCDLASAQTLSGAKTFSNTVTISNNSAINLTGSDPIIKKNGTNVFRVNNSGAVIISTVATSGQDINFRAQGDGTTTNQMTLSSDGSLGLTNKAVQMKYNSTTQALDFNFA